MSLTSFKTVDEPFQKSSQYKVPKSFARKLRFRPDPKETQFPLPDELRFPAARTGRVFHREIFRPARVSHQNYSHLPYNTRNIFLIPVAKLKREFTLQNNAKDFTLPFLLFSGKNFQVFALDGNRTINHLTACRLLRPRGPMPFFSSAKARLLFEPCIKRLIKNF